MTFTFTTTTNSTPTVATSATLTNGVGISSVDLPIGVDSVTATYAASGSFAGSNSPTPINITVNPPVLVPLPGNPIALPFTMTTIAGGSTVTNANTVCAGSVDTFGDGCLATSMAFNGTVDLRGVVADPFGNVYLTDATRVWCARFLRTALSAILREMFWVRLVCPPQLVDAYRRK